MSDKKDYKDLSIDEKMLLLDGKLAYLDKLVDYYEGKISKLEQLEKTLQASDTQKDEPVVSTDVESTAINTVEEAVKEEPVAETDTQTDSEPVAMGGSFGFGGNEALDEEYAPVEKEPIILENVPLGGSFGFEAEDTKVATISNIEEETTENVEETAEEPVAEADSEPVAMGGSFGFGGNEALDEEYAPVEKEPIVLENVPLGGSFGFEAEDTKVATISSIEEEATENVEKPTVRTPIEIATEDSNEPDDMIVSFKK